MKLNEFKQVDERWDLAGQNNFGGAQLKKLKNKLTGSPDSAMSTRDTRAKQIFIDNFVEKASAGLEKAIQSGAISTAAQPPAQNPQADPNGRIEPTMDPVQQQPAQPQQPATAQQSAQPQKIDPAKAAELKGRLKGKAAPTSAASGFKNYVGGSGERMTGVDKSGAPIFKKIQRESKYQMLDALFESIMEAGNPPTISSFVMDAFKAFAQGPGLSDPKLMQQAQTLANEVQNTYPKDKGVAALRKLGDVGYTVATAQPQQASAEPGTATQPAQQAAQPATQQATAQQPAQQATATDTGSAAPAKGQISDQGMQVFKQMKTALSSLTAEEQRRVLRGLIQYAKIQKKFDFPI